MKKTLSLVLALVMAIVAIMGLSTVAFADDSCIEKDGDGKYVVSKGSQTFYSFTSSSSGGTWYNMVGGAVNLYNEKIANVNFSIEASGGSVENVRRVSSGESEFGLGYASHIYECMHGTGSYEGRASSDIRVISNVFASAHYFVTTKDTGITCLADLAGKTVSLGEAGSGTSANSRMTFDVLGIDVNAVEMSPSDASRALQDGQIVAFGQGGAPASGVVELAASKEVVIIPFTDEELAKISEVAPYFYAGVLPANTYEGQTEDVATFYYAVYMICHKDVPDDIVAAAIACSMEDENLAYLTTVHKQWATMKYDAEGPAALGIEYHPGALAYWKEVGIAQ